MLNYPARLRRPIKLCACLLSAAILAACGGGDDDSLNEATFTGASLGSTDIHVQSARPLAAAPAELTQESIAALTAPIAALAASAVSSQSSMGNGVDTPIPAPNETAAAPDATDTVEIADLPPTSAGVVSAKSGPIPMNSLATGVKPITRLAARVAFPAATKRAPGPATVNDTAAATECGVDVGGWTIPVPSKASTSIALRNMQQPGSRLYYISAANGSDATGDIYFWDGNRIIDSASNPANSAGLAYGTDPMNPSAAVKRFKRWAYVAPRAAPNADIGSTGAQGGSTTPSSRGGFPDWWMFARGETYDLSDDLLSFERETKPTAISVNASLSIPGGRSVTERQIVGAFGNLCLPRPRFVHPQQGFVTRFTASYATTFKNVAYLSLHFDNHDRPTGAMQDGVFLLGQTTASTDILFEDVWLDAATINIGQKNAAQITFRRMLLTDNFATDGSHVEGIYYDGTKDGRLRIEESILLRNGFSRGDPKTLPWPPTGQQTWDMYSRNLYINGEVNSMQSGMFDSVSMMGASGDQFRPGMRVERNFFYQGYVSMGAHGGYADAVGATGSILDNVVQRFTGTGTNDNRGHPGWGIQLGGGAYAVEVARNIVTGAQSAPKSYGFQFMPFFQDCYARFAFATRANRVTDNVFDSGQAAAAISVKDGADASTTCYGMTGLGVRSNTVSNNVLINGTLRESEYLPVGTALNSAPDTVYQGNRIFATRAAAAAALGNNGGDRTLKTYLAAKGITTTSADGFPEYFERAIQQRRGQWNSAWTSLELVNHFRAGFGKTALAASPPAAPLP
ncbi:MAG: hypothetical protein H7315_03985 [Herminiimonas sp.]|nr:hypothetical protein [Herminiimonas sp.]